MRNIEKVPMVVAKPVKAMRFDASSSVVAVALDEDCVSSGDKAKPNTVTYDNSPNVAKGISVNGIVEYGPVNTSAQDPTAAPSSVLPHITEMEPSAPAFIFAYVKYAVSRIPIDATLPIMRRN